MKKGIFIIILLILGYNSVYFRKLSEVRNQKQSSFNFKAFADSLYYQGILKSNHAVELSQLMSSAQSNPDSAFKTYGNRLGIGNSAYFMIKGEGKVIEKQADGLKVATDNNIVFFVDTKYIFGNAIRDASGLVKLTDFKTNADFNKLSEELNTIIREKVIPQDLKNIKVGDKVIVSGATKLSKKQDESLAISILPIRISKSE
jgi:predicted lipoprotein